MGKKRPQHEQVPQFFRRFFGGDLGGGLVELRVFPNTRGPIVDRAWVRDHESFSDFVAAHDDKAGQSSIYFGPALRAREGGKKKDVLTTHVVWTEIDCDKIGWDAIETAKVIHDLRGPVQPSVCIHSGHGLHLYWYLSHPCDDVPKVEGVNMLLSDTFAGDRVWNIDRVMRVPWSWNTKSRPVQSRVLWNYHWHRGPIGVLHDAVSDFDSVLDTDGFVAREVWEQRDAERRERNTDPRQAWTVATEDKRKRANARGIAIWNRCRYGGGPGYVGLDEAVTLFTAYEYCRLTAPTQEKLDRIVTDTMRRVREVYERDAAHEQWNWRDEEKEVRDKLNRWVRKWDEIKGRDRPKTRSRKAA